MSDEVSNFTNQKRAEQLLEYIKKQKYAPWREKYLETVRTCYAFKELDQWSRYDAAKLAEYGVPEIAVDRINRGLDTIKGIWANARGRKKVIPRELGDERVASLLDRGLDFITSDPTFADAEEDSFDNLLVTGLGIRKEGFDPQGDGGFGKFWSESLNIEDVYMGYSKRRDFSDSNWYCHRTIKTYEQALAEFPDQAEVLNRVKARLQTEWDKMSSGNSGSVTAVTRDYGNRIGSSTSNAYDDMVEVWEFWIQNIVPLKKIKRLRVDESLNIVQEIVLVDANYTLQEGEELIAHTYEEEWWQYIVVGNEKYHELLGEPKKSKYGCHPFVFECAERKKDGSPRGYVEVVIPHQVRINIAWGQKVAYNNKSIKTPIAVRGVTDVSKIIQQSQIGAVLLLKAGEDIVNYNAQPPLDLQAIEEGKSAREDMDFAAAATEEALRGSASPGDSGVKMSLRQSASLTPLNKWVRAHKRAELTAYQKRLKMMIIEWGDKPAQWARIVGVENFMRLFNIEQNPLTGEILEQALQMPISIDVAQYDVKIDEEAISDFKKQQTFNAAIALHGMKPGGMFTDEFLIKNAPLADVEEALQANLRHRQEMMQSMLSMVQGIPAAQGLRGAVEPQNGQQSMLGGTSPQSPLGVQ